MTLVKSERITIHDSPSIRMELEFTRDMVIIHTPEIREITVSAFRTAKQVHESLDKFLALHYPVVWTACKTTESGLNKITQRLGFIKYGTTTIEGEEYFLYIRDLHEPKEG